MSDAKQFDGLIGKISDYQIIKKPISMKQINKNIISKYKTLKQFKDDVYLMFDNARIYNGTRIENT